MSVEIQRTASLPSKVAAKTDVECIMLVRPEPCADVVGAAKPLPVDRMVLFFNRRPKRDSPVRRPLSPVQEGGNARQDNTL